MTCQISCNAISAIPLSALSLAHGAQDFDADETRDLVQMRYWDQVNKDAYRCELQGRMQALPAEGRS